MRPRSGGTEGGRRGTGLGMPGHPGPAAHLPRSACSRSGPTPSAGPPWAAARPAPCRCPGSGSAWPSPAGPAAARAVAAARSPGARRPAPCTAGCRSAGTPPCSRAAGRAPPCAAGARPHRLQSQGQLPRVQRMGSTGERPQMGRGGMRPARGRGAGPGVTRTRDPKPRASHCAAPAAPQYPGRAGCAGNGWRNYNSQKALRRKGARH